MDKKSSQILYKNDQLKEKVGMSYNFTFSPLVRSRRIAPCPYLQVRGNCPFASVSYAVFELHRILMCNMDLFTVCTRNKVAFFTL